MPPRRADDGVTVPMGRHGLSPDAVAEQQRERLFSATVELVAKRGYLNTSVDQIVKAARVGYVAFYNLYSGKEECFLSAFDRIVEEAVAELHAQVPSEGPWPQQVAAGLASLLDLIVADPQRARIALVEVQAAGPRAYERYEEAVDRAMPKLREGRVFRPDAARPSETLEEAVLGGIIWIVHQRLVKGELGQIQLLLAETIQLALSPYVGETEAQRAATAALRQRRPQ